MLISTGKADRENEDDAVRGTRGVFLGDVVFPRVANSPPGGPKYVARTADTVLPPRARSFGLLVG